MSIIFERPLLQGFHPELQLYAVYIGGNLDKIAEALQRFDKYEAKALTFHRGLDCAYIEPDEDHNSIELRKEIFDWFINREFVDYINCPLMAGGGIMWARSMLSSDGQPATALPDPTHNAPRF